MPKLVFVSATGEWTEIEAPVGASVLEMAHRCRLELEGACEGSLACSTCHVIVDPTWFDVLESPSDDEEDMLDLAYAVTKTSRLGCQLIMRAEFDGLVVRLPSATRNLLKG